MIFFILSDLAKVGRPVVLETGTENVTVSWEFAAGNIDGYAVTCSTSGELAREDVVVGADNRATCVGLTPGTVYDVRVTSLRGGFDNVTSASETAATSNSPLKIICY